MGKMMRLVVAGVVLAGAVVAVLAIPGLCDDLDADGWSRDPWGNPAGPLWR